jgi:hypothetical protein
MSFARSTLAALALVALATGCADRDITSPTSAAIAPNFDMGESGGGVSCVLNTQLRPENEVPTSTSTATGHAQIKVRNDGSVEWKVFILNPDGETFRAGHIHRAPAGTPGGVVIPLFSSTGVSDRQIHDRGETPPGHALAAELCDNASAFYVNYHTANNPAGALRGQLGD